MGEGLAAHPCSTSAAARACSPTSGRSACATAAIVGIDLEDPAIQAEWAKRQAPNLEYKIMKAETFPFADGEFELASAIEVLEHVPDPEHTVAEMARVARGGHLLVSVPREPMWRGLNMARGAYIKDLGNTPGHLNHWSRKAFVELLAATARSRRSAPRSRGPCCSSRRDPSARPRPPT